MLEHMGFHGSVEAISNGVDVKRFSPASLARRRAGPSDPPIVLYTGRLDEDKDVDTLIRAIPLVLREVSAVFRVGGEGTDRARLERLPQFGLNHGYYGK